MRLSKALRADQDNIKRFAAVLGGASVEVHSNKRAKPDLFITAHRFIVDYVDGSFFKKEELLIKILEDGGFALEEGPIAAMNADQKKCRELGEAILNVAQQWQSGDEAMRVEMGSVSNECASMLRQHLERLKTRIFPLIEQTISIEDEDQVSETINSIQGTSKDGTEKYIKLIEELEEELSDWK